MKKGDEASPSTILVDRATGMKKDDEASPSINLAGRALLVTMLITLEPCYVFVSNFEYLCILTLSSYWYAKDDKASPRHFMFLFNFLTYSCVLICIMENAKYVQ